MALVHIAEKDLGLSPKEKETAKWNIAQVVSAADMTDEQLRRLILYYGSLGWESKGDRTKATAEALRKRAYAMAAEMERGTARLAALSLKVCGVSRVEWCGEIPKLRQLLVVLQRVSRKDAKNAKG